MVDLYTIVFNFCGGTYTSQVEADTIDDVLELWLQDLKDTLIDHKVAAAAGAPLEDCETVMDYFNSCTENKTSFEGQVRAEMYPNVGPGEKPTKLNGVVNTWSSYFLVQLSDDEHREDCPIDSSGEPHPECPACTEDASALGDLVIVKTTR